jgi:hypothetical protein
MDRITGSDALGMMEAYNAVYAPQELTEEQVWEEVEVWVNSLVEEGYDLSEYTWEDMYEYYLSEGPYDTANVIRAQQAQSSRDQASAAASARQSAERRSQDVAQYRASMGSSPTASAKPTSTTFQNTGGFGRYQPPSSQQYGNQSRFAGARDAAFERARQIQGSPVVGPRLVGSGSTPPQTRPTPAPAGTSRPNAPVRPATPSYSGATGVRPVVTPLPTGAVTPVAGAPAQNAPVSAPTTAPTAPARTFNPLMQRTFGYQTGNSPSQLAAASAGKPIPSGTALGSAANPQVRASLGLPALPTTSPAPTTSTAPVTPTRRVVTPTRAPILQRSHFDPFDVVMGYLIDEGYAENEEAASVIMANMSEEWRQSIVEQSASLLNTIDTLEKKVQKMNQRQPGSANLSRRGEQTPAAALYKAYGRLNGV